MIRILHSKISSDGGGVIHKPRTPGTMQQVIEAQLVIALYQGGAVRILKDRFSGSPTPLSGRLTTAETVANASFIIANCVFGENDLKMFKEGLTKEIEKAVNKTIKQYHKKVR